LRQTGERKKEHQEEETKKDKTRQDKRHKTKKAESALTVLVPGRELKLDFEADHARDP
jgi:hypothetical protein